MGTIRDERGVALPAVMMVIVMLALMGASYVAYTTAGMEQVIARNAEQVAQEYSESGLEAAKRQLDVEPQWTRYDGHGAEDVQWSAGKGGKKLSAPADDPDETYVLVEISYSGTNSRGEREYDVISEGHEGDAARRLRATITTPGYAPVDPPVPPVSPPGTPREPVQANNDNLTLKEDGEDAINVLANDTPRGALTVVSKTAPTSGRLSCARAGRCTYEPRRGYSGRDSFDYVASDGASRDTARVSIRVIPEQNTPPPAEVRRCVTKPGAVGVIGRQRQQDILDGEYTDEIIDGRGGALGTGGDDIMHVGGGGITRTIAGSNGDDVIVVGSGDIQASISGGPGNDLICVSGGAQGRIYGDPGKDALFVGGLQRHLYTNDGAGGDLAVNEGVNGIGTGNSCLADATDRRRNC